MEIKSSLFSDAFGLHVKNNDLLIGVGNQAFLYTKGSRIELPQRTRNKKVHGFVHSSSDDLVLLYSENEFYIFLYHSEEGQFQLVYEGETKDWINAATFLENEEKTRFVLHMAHSTVLYLQWISNSSSLQDSVDLDSEKKYSQRGDCIVLELACCTDYSMLYYTCLHGSTYDQLVIMSGNAFGELLIWRPQFAIARDDDGNEVSGSKTYPLLLRLQAHNGVILSIAYNAAKQLLITTSDDRSVKFWRVANTETKDYVDWKTPNSVSPMFSCFGHTARVMCSIVMEYGNDIYVASGGEDSYMCIWNSSGELLLKRRQQFGAPIWQLAYNPTTSTIYSGGSTGNVLTYNVKALLEGKTNNQLTQLCPLDSFIETKNEFIGNVQFLSHTTIIGLSNRNRLFFINLFTDSLESQNWQLLDNFPSYKCTVLETKNEIIATCGYQRVTLHRFSVKSQQLEQLFDGPRLKGTIRSFHFLATDLYLVSDDLGNCELLKGNDLHVEAEISLVHCREPWITAALLVSPKILLLSNRNGLIMLFIRNTGHNQEFTLISQLKHIHGNMGSTFLNLVTLTSKEACILSGGHEPLLKYLRLNLNDYKLTISLRKCVPLAWIEASLSDDIVLGFNDNHFVAWSQEQDVLIQLQCGGGHRCWDYHLLDKELHIIFVKQKQVFFHHYRLCDKESSQGISIPRNRWHTRSCNSLRLLGQIVSTDSAHFLASAGDDNVIKITKYFDGNAIQCAEVHTHISSVRHLTIYPLKSKNYLASWLIFSVGGRAQLCINQIDRTQSNDCRITELSSHTLRNPTVADNGVVEARLMAIDVSRDASSGYFMLYIANADGKITIHRWQIEKPSTLEFLHQIDLHRCPLQLRWLPDPSLLLIATTNGEIYVYDNEFRTKMLQFQLHETGVNTLDAYVDRDNIHILSGGDDENVKHTTINLYSMDINQKAFAALHNAQVNALALYCHSKPDGEKTDLFGFTCSMDKQIYRINLQTSEYFRVGYTCIDDIKGILIDENQLAYLYGSGLQVLPLS
ncbi:uncharacterized protein Dwil_GK16250 [Drosophila willistoni]|uniref:tRNA (34-2'-O)-methyltransferase regulator WDR6 n=1 Tax=Drosophila willistoni TaxID=7260 RepID=B4N1Q3_DROWI|nr:WD repeat-containing protein 6 [Drosophila willistoni]EDW78292.2 uncharacterized protein Dwil_GK16250 [Drosophila willistoni]